MKHAITIWGRRNSINVKKVLWIADEIGLDYQREVVGGSFGGCNTDAFSELNPNRLVPCIQDGDTVLWESNAIVRYLARRYALGELMPQKIEKQAQVDQWHDWSASVNEPLQRAFMMIVRTPEPQRDPKQLAFFVTELNNRLRVVDAHLSKQEYLLSDRFSVADVPLGALASRYFAMDIEHLELKHFEAWYARLQKRKAYRDRVMLPSGSSSEQWLELEREDKGR